jgi:hypothetical protein
MDAIEAIMTRRRIRKYRPAQIPGKLTTEILEAMGYPAEKKPRAGLYDSTRVRTNGW